MKFEKERDLCAVVKSWLIGRGGAVYEEIKYVEGEAIADIVYESELSGTRKAHVFEAKLSLNLTVVRQGVMWRQWSDAVWLCVPQCKTQRNRDIRAKTWPVLEMCGLGLIAVSEGPDGKGYCEVILNATESPAGRSDELLRRLNPDYQGTAQAGSAGGSNSGRWADTVQKLIDAAKETPGVKLRILVKGLGLPYKDDREAFNDVRSRSRQGNGIRGLRLEGNELLVFADEARA